MPIVVAAVSRQNEAAAPVSRPPARAAALPRCTIIGTAGADTLIGTRGDDVICALGGDDTVRGRGGDDVLFGSRGDDLVDGGPGADRLYGFRGTDRLRGRGGRDFLQGGPDADVLSGGRGQDVADYGLRSGPVRVSLGRGANDGAPGEGDDVRRDVERVRGGRAGDTLIGNARANRLYGRGGDDDLDGGRGDDRLWGGGGRDRLDGRDSARFVDALDCGAGAPDTALADARDRVADNCEDVTQPGRPNHAPTGIRLSNQSVAENRPAGTLVGTLAAADQDAGDEHRFSLVAGAGDADNGAFAIAGDQLRTAAVFNFEAKSRYSIRIRVGDGHGGSYEAAFTITVTDVAENHPPTGISLSNSSVAENKPAGTVVGTLSASDPDAGDTHTFALAPGAGSNDNGSFQIVGSTLTTAAVFDYETKRTYSVRIRATDHGTPAGQIVRAFTITVTDTSEPPAPEQGLVIATPEDAPVSITLSATDVEGDPATFDVSQAAHGSVVLVGVPSCNLQTPKRCTHNAIYTPDPDYNGSDGFTYTASDAQHTSEPATVSVTVQPINDAPTASDGSRTTAEDTPLALDLGALADDKESADGDLTYTIVSGPAHGQLSGSGPNRTYTPNADFNGADEFSYRVTDRGDPDNCGAPGPACDPAETSTTETVSITVGPVNDAPHAADGSLGLDEDAPAGAAVDLGPLVSDAETGDDDLAYTIDIGPAHGQLSGGGANWTYVPDADYNGQDGFTYRVTDRGDPDNCGTPGPNCAAPETRTATVSIRIAAVNDTPVNTLPAGPITAVSDTNVPIGGVSVTDIDAGDQPVQVMLSVLHGTITVNTAVLPFGVGQLDVAGNGTASVTITAPPAAINTTFADPNGIVYHSDAAYTGADTLTVATDDLGNSGAGGNQTDTDTLAIDVVPPNAPPVASPANATSAEDTATMITLRGSDTDGDALTFAIDVAPTHGSVGAPGTPTCGATPNTCTAAVTYTPDPDYNGADSFSFTVNDGRVDSAPATVSIMVTAVNDAPRLENIETGALAYTENDPALAIIATTTVSDIDSPDFDTGTLTVDFTAGATAEDRLEVANQGIAAGQISVSGSTVSYAATAIGTFAGGTGTVPLVVTLNANATTAAVQALVRAISYRNVSDNPSTADARTVRFVLTDGDGGTSAPATRAIALSAVNDAPTIASIESTALAYIENGPATPISATLTLTDPDSPNIASATVQLTGGYQNGADVLAAAAQFGVTASFDATTGTLTLTGATTIANYEAILRAVTYLNTSDAPSTLPRTVTFKANDGSVESAGATRNISVTAVDDAPTLTAGAGSTPYTEQAAPVAIDGALTLSDPDGGSPTGATVTIVSPVAGDTLSFTDQNGITGSFASGVLTLSGTATPAQYQAALRSVQFFNATSDAPGTSRSIEFKLTAPVASNTTTKALAITQVNDAPATDTTDAAASALEQTATAVDPGIVVSDPDSASLTGATVQITGNFQSGQDTLQFTSQNGITGSFAAATGTLTLTGSATVAQYQTALRSVTYTNTSNTPSTATRTITFRVTDDGTPGLQSAPQTRDLGVVPVNDAPTDAGESQSATGNTRLEVELTSGGSTNPKRASATGNLLDNAADVDDAAAALSVDVATVGNPPNGTVSVNADGSYVYTPDVGFTGADSFTYRVKDDEKAQSGLSTVSITVANRVWYVRADAAAGGDGRSETPFNTLTAADTAANATGDTIYVFRKAGDAGSASDSSLDLLANQRLLGSAVDLTDGAVTLYDGGAGLQPSLTTTSVKLDDGNSVRGLAVSGSGSGAEALEAGSGDVGGTLDLLSISGNTGGIELANGAGGTWNLNDVTVNTTGGDAIVAANAGTVNFTGAGTISVTTAAGRGLNLTGTTTSGTVDSTTVTSSPNEGIRLDDNPGSLTVNDVNLTTTGTGLDVDSSNDVTVSGGDADITSAGPAVNLTTVTSDPANPPDVALDQVTSTGGTTGINIDDIGAGTFSANGGTLSGHTGAEIDINAGTGNVTYPGTIGNGSGLSVQITGRSAGTVALAGNINDTNDAGGGIDMSTNGGGTYNFTGTVKKLDTGTGAAFSSTGSNPTINLTGGGLDIDTTTGTGFAATGGGTVTVGTGANPNTIGSGAGTALNVGNTTIGSGLTFRSISANGATNGIVVNNTGTSAGLTVSGDGTNNGSGGTIQATTGSGISLARTRDISLRSMSIQSTGGSGIDGTGVTNFSFVNGTINNSGDAALESNIAFNGAGSALGNNIAGTLTVTGSTLTNAYLAGIDIESNDGTVTDANLSNNTITSSTNQASTKGSGIMFNGTGTATTVFKLMKAAIADNVVTNFPSGSGIFVSTGNSSATGQGGIGGVYGDAANVISITGNKVRGQSPASITNSMAGFGIAVVNTNGNPASRGSSHFNITGNGTAADPLRNMLGQGVQIGNNGYSDMEGAVVNNVIEPHNINASQGIGGGNGVAGAGNAWTPHLRLTVSQNTISQTDGSGILLVGRSTSGQMDLRVDNNNVATPTATTTIARRTVSIEAGNNLSNDDAVCLNVHSNTVGVGLNGGAAIAVRKQGNVSTVNDFGIQGIPQAAPTNAEVQTYLAAQNPAASGVDVLQGPGYVQCNTAPPG